MVLNCLIRRTSLRVAARSTNTFNLRRRQTSIAQVSSSSSKLHALRGGSGTRRRIEQIVRWLLHTRRSTSYALLTSVGICAVAAGLEGICAGAEVKSVFAGLKS